MTLSIRGTHLRPTGHFSRAGRSGRLARLGRAPEGPLGLQVIEHAKALHSKIGDPELSIAVRGSLARGGHSPADIDLVFIHNTTPKLPPLAYLPPLPLPVEASLIPLQRFEDQKEGAWPRFALAYCGWTLAGPERLKTLPEPRMGKVVIAHLRGVQRWWPRHPEGWESNMAERRLDNGWLAKRIIRSLAEGEMLRRGVYSRDIWPCLQLACLAFPAHTELLIRIAEQAIRPSGEWQDRRRLLDARALLEAAYARHLRKPLKLPR